MEEETEEEILEESDYKKELIEGNEMLTDESINLAMNLIHEQFPRNGGLTDSSTDRYQQFDIMPLENGYIQILHAAFLH